MKIQISADKPAVDLGGGRTSFLREEIFCKKFYSLMAAILMLNVPNSEKKNFELHSAKYLWGRE